MLHIIHLSHRTDRMKTLLKELQEQQIVEYEIWEGVYDKKNPKTGIAKSHKKIVKWAKDKKLPAVIIAEDDVKFTDIGAYKYFIENNPKKYDLYLGGITHGQINSENTVKDFSGLTIYSIQERFYDEFISLPETKDIDRLLADKGLYMVCNPLIATQYDGFSDNQQKYQQYSYYFKNRRLYKRK